MSSIPHATVPGFVYNTFGCNRNECIFFPSHHFTVGAEGFTADNRLGSVAELLDTSPSQDEAEQTRIAEEAFLKTSQEKQFPRSLVDRLSALHQQRKVQEAAYQATVATIKQVAQEQLFKL